VAALKAHLQAVVPTAALFDTSAQVARLEQAFNLAWQRYAQGQACMDIHLA